MAGKRRRVADDEFQRISVEEISGYAFSEYVTPSTWEVHYCQREYRGGMHLWIAKGYPLVTAKTEAEARKKAAALLRKWARELLAATKKHKKKKARK